MPDYNKPLYSLTVGEFIELTKETMLYVIKGQQPLLSTPQEQEEHFTIQGCAGFLHCSVVSIHNYKKQGMPYYRVGRKVLFKKSEVLEFMTASKLRIKHRTNIQLKKVA